MMMHSVCISKLVLAGGWSPNVNVSNADAWRERERCLVG